MGHHINAAGEFQSDKYQDLKPDKIVVSFKHPEAWPALEALADGYEYKDPDLAADIRQRLRAIGSTPPKAARERAHRIAHDWYMATGVDTGDIGGSDLEMLVDRIARALGAS